jgi:hypothetical protein
MKKLEPDLAERQALLLVELIAVQRGSNNGSLAPPSTSSSSINDFQPSSRNIVINILWASSLVLTLILSLLIMLLKQWMRNYSSNLSPDIDRRERLRHFRFRGFRKWRVESIMTYSPFLLHLSLFLFVIGLVLATSSLHVGIFSVSLILAGISALLYFVAGCLPAFYADCPYGTPLSRIVFGIKVLWRTWYSPLMAPSKRGGDDGSLSTILPEITVAKTPLQFETEQVEGENRDEAHIDLINWLAKLPDGKYTSIAVQALAGLPVLFEYPNPRSSNIDEDRRVTQGACTLLKTINTHLSRLQWDRYNCPILEPSDGHQLNSLVLQGSQANDKVHLNIGDFSIASLRHITRVIRAVMYKSSRAQLSGRCYDDYHVLSFEDL